MMLRLFTQAAGSGAHAQGSALGDSALAPDTAVVVSPLPGGAAAVSRWLLNLPQWIQVAGALLALAIGIGIVVLAWRRRRALRAWLAARPQGWKVALAGAVALLLVSSVVASAKTWNFMQHDNGFCVSCHVMTPSYARFQGSEHRKLQCHDCHRQSIFVSASQLYFWVAERPEKIPPHAKVPTRICAECHIQDRPDSVWKRISATAGHRVHLASDSSALKEVQCVTCHGQEVHRFAPVDRTCGQSGCHEDVRITLGKMRDQTSLHCTGCHAFTRQVSEAVPLDSARGRLAPAARDCLGCHEMRERMGAFDPLLDPHEGSCGACHNAHTQETPAAAFETCTNSGCHVRADTLTPFHRGIGAAALARCGDCHVAHEWKMKETTCLTCHAGILRDGGSPRAASGHAPTSRQAMVVPIAWRHQAAPANPAARGDFSHRRHRDVSCAQCHSMARTHGELTVRTERDCQSCHHGAEKPAGDCARCHTQAELAPAVRVSVPVKLTVWPEPRQKSLPFDHDEHRTVRCADCHTQAVTLAVERGCTSCHAQHHEPARTCTACHVSPKEAHTRVVHLGCTGTGCHVDEVTPTLAATRSTCLTCHVDMVRHRPGRQCAACHQVSWRPGAVRTASR